MRHTVDRLIKQETHLEYFHLRSLLTNLALQHREKLSANRLASLLVIATKRKPSAVKAAASAALSSARAPGGRCCSDLSIYWKQVLHAAKACHHEV
jgi:hypothetical protein